MEPKDVVYPFAEFATGVLFLIVAILFHGMCLRIVNRRFSRAWSRVTVNTPAWRINMHLAGVVGSLVAIHLVEPVLFAAPLLGWGAFENPRDSYFFVIQCYTTLGSDRLSAPEGLRLIGPMIAMAGLFTFGWTSSVLVTVMGEVSRFDGARAQRENAARDEAGRS